MEKELDIVIYKQIVSVRNDFRCVCLWMLVKGVHVYI